MIWGLLTALQSIILYILVIIPTEYYLTEHTQILKFLNARVKSLIFIFLFILVFIFNYFIIKNIKYWLPITLLFLLSLFGYYKYQQYYAYLQRFPEIYSITPGWSLQGKKTVIQGKNFGPPHDNAHVKAGEVVFYIHKWTNKEIIAIQPITNNYGPTELYVVRENGNQSNKMPFEIRDPADLSN